MSRPQVRFCQVGHGQHIAYAVQGRGPLVVLTPWCVSHLERDLLEPKLQAFYDRLATRYTVVRYDHTGVGLSDKTLPMPPSPSFSTSRTNPPSSWPGPGSATVFMFKESRPKPARS